MSGANRRNFSTVAAGQDSVATAGTAEQLNGGTSLPVPQGSTLTIRANSGLTGSMYVGDSTVSSSTGYILAGGETVTLAVDDVAEVWIDTDSGGQGVSWVVEADA